VILGDQRTERAGRATVAAEQEARHCSVLLGIELGRRQAPTQPRQKSATVSAEMLRVVAADRGPHRISYRGHLDAAARRFAGRCLPHQPMKSPGILESK